MKKTLLLSLFAAFSLAASAQKISVTVKGQPIQNEEVVTFYAEEKKDDQGVIREVVSGDDFDPTIHNLTDDLMLIEGTLSQVNEGSDWDKVKEVTWCLGSCMTVQSFPQTMEAEIEPEPTDWPSGSGLHCKFTPGEYATAIFKVELREPVGFTKEHLMTYYIKSVYDAEHAGINDLTATAPAFNLNGRNLLYSFSTAAPRCLDFYSLDGRLAASYAVNGEVGTLSLSALPAGSYVMSLLFAGKTIKSEKIILGR